MPGTPSYSLITDISVPSPPPYAVQACAWNIIVPPAPALLSIPLPQIADRPVTSSQKPVLLSLDLLLSGARASPGSSLHLQRPALEGAQSGVVECQSSEEGTKDRREEGRARGGGGRGRSVARRRRREGARAPAAAAQGRGRAPSPSAPSLSPPRRRASPNLLEMQPRSPDGRQRRRRRRRGQRQPRRRGEDSAG
jgi:hypothetical protein